MTATDRPRDWRRARAKRLRDHPLCARCLEGGKLAPATTLDEGGTTPLCEQHRDDE